jgi:hypothetical protein
VADTFLGSVYKYNKEKNDDTHKKKRRKRRERTAKKGQRLWKKSTITEKKETKKGIIPSYSSSTRTSSMLPNKEDVNSRK